MGVQSHDDVTFGIFYAGIHGIGDYPVRIVQQVYVGILLSILQDNSPRGIIAESVNKQYFQILFVVILIDDGLQAVVYIFFFVVYRYNYAKHDG